MTLTYQYTRDDMFYDVESLANVFSVAWWLPHPDMNAIILSYLDDDNIIQTQEDLEYIREYIYAMYPNLKATNTQIVFENIGNTGCINEFIGLNGNTHSVLGMQSFAKRMGLANASTHLNSPIERRHMTGGGLTYDPAYFPVKQTDPDYNENEHGYRFGYNSTNYDMTILAELFGNLHDNHFQSGFTNRPVMSKGEPLTASKLRDFNDELFHDTWRGQMSKRLAFDSVDDNPQGYGNYKKPGWILRRSWLLSGRHIDVARLNEGQRMVGLKRLLGMLGLHIMESDKLDGHNSKINNLNEMAELLAYNISDVVNLQVLFEHSVYQNSFIVRGKLLETYPSTIYAQTKGFNDRKDGTEMPADVGNPLSIRRDRLTRDSSSAKFVEYAIAPYSPLKDIPKVSFMYPSEQEARKLGIEQVDVLEDTKKYFEENVTSDPNDQAHKDFMQVYHFYDGMRGNNFNASKAYAHHYSENMQLPVELQPKNRDYIKELMTTHNTNLFYHFVDDSGGVHRTSCLANFSVGGIHGAEINLSLYNADLEQYQVELKVQNYVESLYSDAHEAINGPIRITLPEDLVLPLKVVSKIDENGEIKIREFIKSGSTKAKAGWQVVPEVQLFRKNPSGNWAVVPRYSYVSVGPAHHEDFTSYYPLLLSRLSAFINPSYHGYEENGEPKDPYYQMFLDRISKRAESRDASLPAEVRNMADLEQESRKLLINAASGVGDAPFDNNIRVNNVVTSMRIIGQLFAWRIGQAQSLAGARVPSTNTDGLYIMGISAVVNDRILEETAKDMHVTIEPERLDRFVTKDSNNRLEIHDGKIQSASGGTLNSWRGPQPTKALDHAAVIDNILARYLADERFENPADIPFDRDYAEQMFQDYIQERIRDGKLTEILQNFQWVNASSAGTHRYIYAKEINKPTGEVNLKNLQMYNRIFLIKDDNSNVRQELYLATRRVVNPQTWKRRMKEYENGERKYSDLWEHNADAKVILKANNFDLDEHNNNQSSDNYKDEARTQKVRGMPDNQHVGIFNESIVDIPKEQALQMIQMLDISAYLTILENTFQSWSNL